MAYFQAESYREKQNFPEAMTQYDFVLNSGERGQFAAAARIGKGLCLVAQQRYEEAKKEFDSAIAQNSDDPTVMLRARFEIGNLEAARNNPKGAVKFFMLVAALYEDSLYCPQALWKAGQIFEQLGNPKEALNVYQELVQRFSQHELSAPAQERIKVLSANQ